MASFSSGVSVDSWSYLYVITVSNWCRSVARVPLLLDVGSPDNWSASKECDFCLSRMDTSDFQSLCGHDFIVPVSGAYSQTRGGHAIRCLCCDATRGDTGTDIRACLRRRAPDGELGLLVLSPCVPLVLVEAKAPVLDDVHVGKCRRDDPGGPRNKPDPRGEPRRPLLLAEAAMEPTLPEDVMDAIVAKCRVLRKYTAGH